MLCGSDGLSHKYSHHLPRMSMAFLQSCLFCLVSLNFGFASQSFTIRALVFHPWP